MSQRYKGAVISATPPTVSATSPDPYGTAKGVWTLQQQLQYEGAGTWPSPFTPAYIEDVFSTYLYAGTGTPQTITNGIDLLGNGGLVWIKGRNAAGYNHTWMDTARSGILFSDTAESSNNYPSEISSYNSNGFTLSSNAVFDNTNTVKYASWSFAKKQKFFDVITYTGTGVARTIAHNLGSVPGCIIVKRLDASGAWRVYHRSINATYYLGLNEANAALQATTIWNDTEPTSSVFSVGSSSNTNANGGTYVAYLFAHNAGGFGANGSDNVISCGSYTGNGSAIGPKIDLGFEAQWILVKSSTVSGSYWYLMDNVRGMGYRRAYEFYPNLNTADQLQTKNIVPTANGFQVLTTDGYLNNNGSTYIYVAIRRGPMKPPVSTTDVFNVTNTTASNTIINTGFDIDFVISRSQTATYPQYTNLFTARLQGTGAYLLSNTTATEGFEGSSLPNWDYSRQYNIGNGSIYDTDVYTNYAWKRAPGFFDVVCYTGDFVAGSTQKHNLNVTPELIFVKARNDARHWIVYHSTLGPTKFIELSTDAAEQTSSAYWNNTAPTSSVFSLGQAFATNYTYDYIAYLFASIAGIQKVGSYTGTGTTLQVNCGFTNGVRFVLIKRSDAQGAWYVWDATRGITSSNDPYFVINLAGAQVTNTNYLNTYSAGFEITSSAPAAINANGGTFIYLAIA